MVTSVPAHPGAWLDGVAVAGQDLRLQLASAMLTGASPSGTTGIAARPGVRYGTGNPLLVQAGSGMNITVNAGVAFVQGGASATAGMYTCCLDTTATLTVATSDPTNPRIDNVICWVTDNGNSSSTTVIALQTGTPAPSPVAPTLPTNALLLAQISVAANASSIIAANISDQRVYTAASGGIVPMANTTGGITGPAGLYVHDLSTGRLRVSDGSGNAVAPKTSPFAPITTNVSTMVNLPTGATTNIINANFAVDGVTEVRAMLSLPGIFMPTYVANSIFFIDCYVDSTDARRWYTTAVGPGNSNIFGGGTYVHYVTPSAGTHNISFQIFNQSGQAATVQAGGTAAVVTLRISTESG